MMWLIYFWNLLPRWNQKWLLMDFLVYFENTWIGPVQRGRRRRPQFEIKTWNVFDRTADGLPRTNNSLEGWHHGFQQWVTITHPTLHRLVLKLQKEQSSFEIVIEQCLAGFEPPKKKKKYDIINQRISNIVSNYETYEDKLQYLRAIAHNL